jgi:hypothetical protein
MTEIERVSVHFRMSGPALDVDALLAAARPAGAHEVWRRGDPLDDGHRAKTSGVQVEILDHHDPAEVAPALEAFLDEEAAFLAAVRRFTSDETLAAVGCALWVYAGEPTSLSLPPDLLARLGAEGVTLEVNGYPRED